MKKIVMFLVFTIVFTVLTFPSEAVVVSASCNAYEVVDIQTNGTQRSIGCYNSLSSAQNVMFSYTNGVVKHNASKSPEKIVAATRAVAQSYPYRRASGNSAAVTMNIYQFVDYNVANSKSTYVGSHFELAYFGTESFNASDGTGKVNVGLAGFNGYTNLDQIDIIPLVYIENGISMYLGGKTSPASYEQAYISRSIRQAYFIVESRNGVNELRYVSPSHYASPSTGNRINKANSVIGPAPAWMQVGARYYSWDFVNFYSDNNFKNKVGTYYNYYMFLPLRSETNVTAEQLNAYINSKGYTSKPTGNSVGTTQSQLVNTGATFIQGQTQYGTNALLVFSMAIHESGYGRSNISLNQNNLFGWAAVDSNPGGATQYANIEQSILEQYAYNLRGYMDITDGRFFGTHLGEKKSGFNVKYASDPYWGIKIASYAYEIDKYAGLVDHNYYDLGMINQYAVPFKAQALDSSATLATSQYGSTYQEEFIVIMNQSADNDYIQVMFSNGIRSNGTMITHRVSGTTQAAEVHSFARSVAYLKRSQITPISASKYANTDTLNPIPGVVRSELLNQPLVFNFDSLTINNHNMIAVGHAFQVGITSPNVSNISHKLVFTHKTDASKTVVFDLGDGGLKPSLNTSYGRGQFDYAGATFTSSNIDLSLLEEGKYSIELILTYNNVNFTKTVAVNSLPSGSAESEYNFSLNNNVLELEIVRGYERTLFTRIEKFDWVNDTLYIQGVAALERVSHASEANVNQVLVITNIKTGNEYRYPLTARSHEEINTFYFEIGDGANYQYAWFDANLDVSNLPIGEYQMRIEVAVKSETGDGIYTGQKQMLNNRAGGIPSIHEVNGNSIHFKKNEKYLLRYELSIQKGMLPLLKDIKTPTTRFTSFFMDDFTIKSGILELQGFSYMYNTNHSLAQKPTYHLVFVDVNGELAAEFELETITGLYDVTPNVNSGHSYTHCWFSGKNIDLSILEKGTYQIFIRIQNGDYYDLVPYSSNHVTYSVTGSIANKVIVLERDTEVYNKMTITIK